MSKVQKHVGNFPIYSFLKQFSNFRGIAIVSTVYGDVCVICFDDVVLTN